MIALFWVTGQVQLKGRNLDDCLEILNPVGKPDVPTVGIPLRRQSCLDFHQF